MRAGSSDPRPQDCGQQPLVVAANKYAVVMWRVRTLHAAVSRGEQVPEGLPAITGAWACAEGPAGAHPHARARLRGPAGTHWCGGMCWGGSPACNTLTSMHDRNPACCRHVLSGRPGPHPCKHAEIIVTIPLVSKRLSHNPQQVHTAQKVMASSTGSSCLRLMHHTPCLHGRLTSLCISGLGLPACIK